MKARVVRHAGYARFGGAGSALHEHIAYLGRGGVAEEGGRGVIFDATRMYRPKRFAASASA